MNILKATIAAVAATVCCMGNDYPAKANSVAEMKACVAQARREQAHWFFNETGINYGSVMANSKASQQYVNQLRAMGMQPKTPRPFRLCG